MPELMASSPSSHLSPSSSATAMKFKCVEYGSSGKNGPGVESDGSHRRRQREDPVSNAQVNDFFYFSRGKNNASPSSADEVSSDMTVDSGLSSDTEGFTPPPLPRRANKKAVTGSALVIHQREMDDSQSDVSADSLALNDDAHTELTSLASSNEGSVSPATARKKKVLPSSLLSEIRMKAGKQLQPYHPPTTKQQSVKELGKALDSQLKLRKSSSVPPSRSRNVLLTIPATLTTTPQPVSFDSDAYQRFHMREYPDVGLNGKMSLPDSPVDDLSFAGLKDIMNVEKSGQTIRSHKSGTVRGVRNRVRAGITTFLQGKTFKVSSRIICVPFFHFYYF